MEELRMCDRCFEAYVHDDKEDELVLYGNNEVFMFKRPYKYRLCQDCMKDFKRFILEYSRKQEGMVI